VGDAGGRHDDVDTSEALDGRLRHRIVVLGAGGVEMDEERFASAFLDRADRLGPRVVDDVGDEDVGALFGEADAARAADPVPATRDDGDASFEPPSHVSPPATRCRGLRPDEESRR
jgi:hypothetical protein